MGRALLSFLLQVFFCCFLLFGVLLQEGYGQTTLSPGDIAIIGFNADTNDGFAAVTFTELSKGDEVHFSSEEWNGSAFDGPGGHLTWVAPEGGVSAGTVLVFHGVEDTPVVNVGSIADDINIDLSGSGDVIYAYTGTSQDNPDTFLGATATSSDQYNGVNGTLASTGLSQGSRAILLTENIDVAEFEGSRSGNTQSIYQDELNDIDNWIEENGTGDQSGAILPFDDTAFSLVDPPTIAFSSQSMTVSEDDGSIDLAVELVESNSTDVDVEVALLGGSSTATNGTDFDSFSTETVSFSETETSGTIQTVSINLKEDSEFEGPEKAVFQLQNMSKGTLIEPETLTLTIEDVDTPDIVINEIHADPDGNDGDTDHDGEVDSSDDEFVELINNTSSDIDISGWTFSDEQNLRHTFPDGTVISSGGVLVLFGDDDISPEGNFGGALIQSANESATLSLNNTGDTIELADKDGNTVIELNYPEAGNGQSIVRDPEITGDFTEHPDASDSGGDLYSPGTKADGTAFGSKYAVGIRGSEGWRMISSPTQNTSFEALLGNLWMQGITGSDDQSGDLTLAGWSEKDTSFTVPSNMGDDMTPGKGYIVYAFEDDEFNTPGIQGGFPKVINTNEDENPETVDVTVSANDTDGENGIGGNEGWNLLGNPFGTDLSVSALLSELEGLDNSLNANIYVWDHEVNNGNGQYRTLSDGDRISPFQAFFVRFTEEIGDQNFQFDRSVLEANTGTEFYKDENEDFFRFNFELHGEQYLDTYTLQFDGRGDIELDRYDAYKLFSLNSNSINLFSTHGNNRLQKNVLPKELESSLEIPLGFQANGRSSLTFRWNIPDNFPSDWDISLIDTQTDRKINLLTSQEYRFNVSHGAEQDQSEKQTLLNKSSGEEEESRFVLMVDPNKENMDSEEIPESAKLNPNYPNPFNPTTTIPYELAEDAEVKLTVWNMIGQKVATLVDGMVDAGSHEETWNASNMPSGIYIARFEVDSEVFTRKMTLIK